ncbi:MAG: alpha/beta hydrolase [Ginsengibacter sp.]
MAAQFLKVGNCKIAYIEKNQNASKTIFFISGNSVSKSCWRKQYESDLSSTYRMIAIDFPAHGDSDAAEETSYTLPGLAWLLSKVIISLANGNPYIISGVSLGTNVIAEMLAFEIHPLGIVLAGSSIAGKNFGIERFIKPNTHVGVVFADNPEEEDILKYAHETLASRNEEDLKLFLEDFKKVKPPFRSALGKSIADGNYNDEIALLNGENIPCLMIFGKDELVIDCNYLDKANLPLWHKTIYKIGGASHLVNIDQPEKFNQLLKKFADDIFK